MVKQCYGLNCVTSHSYVDALTLSVIVFGDRDFGRYLGLDEVMRVGISALIRRDIRGPIQLFLERM